MSIITIDPGKKDVKSITGKTLGLIALGILGVSAYVYLLPTLLAIAWGTVELSIAAVIGGLMIMFLSNPKTWRSLNYLSQATSQFLLGWVIEMNPFNILEYKLELAENDAEDLKDYNVTLLAKKDEVYNKLERNKNELQLALEKRKLASERLRRYPEDQISKDSIEECLSVIQSNTDYENSIKPIYNDLVKLIDFTEKAYKSAVLQIKISKKSLSKQRDQYETVTTASSAISKAWKALAGDNAINSDAEKAIENIRKDISSKIANIQSGIKITSEFMSNKNLEDAAKLQLTLKQLEEVKVNELPSGDELRLSNNVGNVNLSVNRITDYRDFLN